MHLTFETLNGRSLTLDLDIEQFLMGPVMSHLAHLQNDCDPADIIRDYLPPMIEIADEDELIQMVGEACMMAVSVDDVHGTATPHFATITGVAMELTDLPYIREHLLHRQVPVLMFPTQYFEPLPAI